MPLNGESTRNCIFRSDINMSSPFLCRFNTPFMVKAQLNSVLGKTRFSIVCLLCISSFIYSLNFGLQLLTPSP